jgi:hypothetical protein
MTASPDQLREFFQSQESLAPDASDVLVTVNQRVRAARRRRLALRATGVSVLGAGIVVGGLQAPSWFDHQRQAPTSVSTASGGGAGSAPSGAAKPAKPTDASSSPADGSGREADYTAYFNAGYDYNDAEALAQLWHENDIGQVKAEAGRKLLAGQDLPISPSGPDSGTATAVTDQQNADLQAYFEAGYDYTDAQQLGQLWKDSDLQQVKLDAGKKLLAGDTLPVAPSGTPASVTQRDLGAFFAAGYGYGDAVELGQLWKDSNTDQVKADAGKKLLAGQTLPFQPGQG